MLVRRKWCSLWATVGTAVRGEGAGRRSTKIANVSRGHDLWVLREEWMLVYHPAFHSSMVWLPFKPISCMDVCVCVSVCESEKIVPDFDWLKRGKLVAIAE